MPKTVMNEKQKQLLEALKLMVVCPAKGRVIMEEKPGKLVSSNYHFLGRNELSLWKWLNLFKYVELNLETELRKLVKQELGVGFEITKKEFSGYLGVTSDTWYELVLPPE